MIDERPGGRRGRSGWRSATATSRRSAASTCGSSPGRSSASSARTGRASPPPSTCCARWPARPAAPPGSPATTCVAERDEVRRNIGLVFQDPTLDVVPHRRAEPALPRRAVRRARAVDRRAASRQVLEMVELCDRRRTPVEDVLRRHEAPAGDRPRPAALARVLFLDEPTDRAGPADPRGDLGLHRRSSASARTSRSSSPRTTWTRPSTATASRSSTTAEIVVLDTPEALKASVGKDRVQIAHGRRRGRDRRARERFGVEAGDARGRGDVRGGRGRASSCRGCSPSSGVPIRSVSVARPDARRRVHDLHRLARSATPRPAPSAGRLAPLMRAGGDDEPPTDRAAARRGRRRYAGPPRSLRARPAGGQGGLAPRDAPLPQRPCAAWSPCCCSRCCSCS